MIHLALLRPRWRMSSTCSAQQAALRAAFGSDSEVEEEVEEQLAAPAGAGGGGWRAHEEEQQGVAAAHPLVPGLHLRRGFLSPAAQAALLAAVRAHGWAPPEERAARNQFMHFGHDTLPPFARRLCADVSAAARGMLPPELLRQPFNQLICNSYEPGQGICAHVDLAAFGDGIASVSLGAPVVMDFAHVEDGRKAAVLLAPGDLLTLHGDVRYRWTHGIAAREADEWEGATVPRGHRVSLTLRRMASDVHVLTEPADDAACGARQV